MSHAMQGHPRWMGHDGEFWQNTVHWRRNGNPLQYSGLVNPMNGMKRQKYTTLEDEPPRSVGVQYATGQEQRKLQKEWSGWAKAEMTGVDVSGGENKVWCHKEQYCIGIWNVRSMNQGKLEVVKEELARGNINILGITELKWMGMGEFNLDDHYIYYCGQESLRRNGVALIVNKKVQNAILGYSLKNDRMILVHFQGKPFNIIIIQVYAPTTNAKEAEVKWFCECLQGLLELTPTKYVLLFKVDWNAKMESQEIPGVTSKSGLGVQMKSGKG